MKAKLKYFLLAGFTLKLLYYSMPIQPALEHHDDLILYKLDYKPVKKLI